MITLLDKLHSWYQEHHRKLPWRDIHDPYRIWLSEVILQQTRIDQGTSYYLRFVEHYPTVSHLAAAPLDEVLKLWEGLGYYSRARNLHKAAHIITEELGGTFPTDYKTVRALPGIGDYTAGAILSFAYDQPYPAVDGNVLRVLSRLYASEEPIDTTQGKKYYTALAKQLVEKAPHPGLHNQAMIELGALICTPQLCDCSRCPIRSECPSADTPARATLPRKALKLSVQPRHLGYLFLLQQDALGDWYTVLYQRTTGDIWAKLYQPTLLYDKPEAPRAELLLQSLPTLPPELRKCQLHPLRRYKHRLTHRQVYIDCYYTFWTDSSELPQSSAATLVPLHDESKWLALPIILKKALQLLASQIDSAE